MSTYFLKYKIKEAKRWKKRKVELFWSHTDSLLDIISKNIPGLEFDGETEFLDRIYISFVIIDKFLPDDKVIIKVAYRDILRGEDGNFTIMGKDGKITEQKYITITTEVDPEWLCHGD